MNDFEIGTVRVGSPSLFLIAGPCVIESEAHARFMADSIQQITGDLTFLTSSRLLMTKPIALLPQAFAALD